MKWSNEAQYFEYLKMVNPKMSSIPYRDFLADLHKVDDTCLVTMDLSEQLETSYPATSPNCLSNYIHICPGEYFTSFANASSQLFYIIRGGGISDGEFGQLEWAEGDLFTLPSSGTLTHYAKEDVALYWVHDQPLLNYLGVVPQNPTFQPTVYRHEQMQMELTYLKKDPQALKRNRNGVLLANSACHLTHTLTPTLWALYNFIPANHVQPAHRHNSVALDFVIKAQEGVYTLVAKEIDENKQLINPKRVDWHSAGMFITPPGFWHSHHNESDEEALILPVQDAGLVTYQRILDIQFLSE